MVLVHSEDDNLENRQDLYRAEASKDYRVMYSLPNRWRKVGFLKLLFIPFGKVGSYSAQAYLCYTQI